MRVQRWMVVLFGCATALACGCDGAATPESPRQAADGGAKAAAPAPAAAADGAGARGLLFEDGVTRGSWVGAIAPELKLESMISGPEGGGPVTLESLRGKVVVVAFWSTHCPTCPTVLPHLNALVDAFKGKPVAFLSILNEPEADVRAFLKQTPVRTWIALDTDISTTNEWFIPGVPMMAVVNAQGVLCAKAHPMSIGVEQVNAALAGKTPLASLPPAPEGLIDKAPVTQLSMMEASIRPADVKGAWGRSVVGGLRLRGHTLREIIGAAWRVEPQLVVSSTLLLDAKYDVTIVPPEGREQEAGKMFQRLLEESFQLRAKLEERPMRAMALRAAPGGAKLSAPASARYDGSVNVEAGQFQFHNSTMANIAAAIYFALGAEVPVLDESGLAGSYDIAVQWTPGDLESLKKTLREKHGLALEPVERPLKALVVERVAR